MSRSYFKLPSLRLALLFTLKHQTGLVSSSSNYLNDSYSMYGSWPYWPLSTSLLTGFVLLLAQLLCATFCLLQLPLLLFFWFCFCLLSDDAAVSQHTANNTHNSWHVRAVYEYPQLTNRPVGQWPCGCFSSRFFACPLPTA